MYIAEHEARLIRANRDEAQVKRAAVLPDLSESRADREVCEVRTVIIDILWEGRDGTIACVSEMIVSEV